MTEGSAGDVPASRSATSAAAIIPRDAEILEAARAFRAALDAIDRIHWERIYIDDFPHSACGHCAEMLAYYLQLRFGITADYVCREFYDADGKRETSHAWLEWNGLIIDISGDQFGWPTVIVSRQSSKHERGREDLRHSSKLDPSWWSQQCAGLWTAARLRLSEHPTDADVDELDKQSQRRGPLAGQPLASPAGG